MAYVGTLEATSPQDLDLIFRVNVRSYYNSMYASIGHMKLNGGGVILNIASIAASAGLKDHFAYSMSKGAVVAMTYSVAKDYLIKFGATVSLRSESIHRLSMVVSIRTTRDLNRKSTTSWLARSSSEEWRSPTKLRRWRCFLAPKRHPSSRDVIIRSTAFSSICGDSHD